MDRSDDEGSEIYRMGPDETVSEAVVYAVADAAGVDPLELDPLYSVVDPGSLDALYSTQDAGRRFRAPRVRVSFVFAGHEVTVLEDRRIRVQPLDSSD